MSVLGALGIISGLSLNLIVHFGLGIQHIGLYNENHKRFSGIPVVRGGILFLSVSLVWVFFSYILIPLSLGFFEYMLVFPLSVLVCMGLEGVVRHFFPNVLSESKVFNPWSAYNGLIPVAVVLSLYLAASLAETLVLSLGFYGGFLLAILILKEIQRRSSLEVVPERLRGVPLLLISMGLLSLIFSSIGTILIKFLGFY